MEQSVIDLKKVEEETKEKIAAVNSQKVSTVAAFTAQMKVWIHELYMIDFWISAVEKHIENYKFS